LLRYTKDRGYKVYGFEFGNEIAGTHGIWATLPADVYVQDFCKLHDIVHQLWEDGDSRPKLVTPDNAFDADWYGVFLSASRTRGCAPDVVTWHQYLLGAGNDPDVGKRALDPIVLDTQMQDGSLVQSVVQMHTPLNMSLPEVWMGEAGGAYNSGAPLVTNRFHSSFWFLDGFGVLAQRGHQTVRTCGVIVCIVL
jgi:heparanase